MAVAEEIFGSRLAPRDFPGIDDRLNLDLSRGAISGQRREPVIDVTNPLTITYKWNTQLCTVKFWADKSRASISDGALVFEPYRV